MNKSTFFNHSLMKRRYSVPETVMRKHKLLGGMSKVKSMEAYNPPNKSTQKVDDNEMNVRDESCQTDECFNYTNRFKPNNSLRKSSKCRRRDSLRYFKKSNSYCQYRSMSMLHKRMLSKHKELNTPSLKQTNDVSECEDKEVASQSENSSTLDEQPTNVKRETDPLARETNDYASKDNTKPFPYEANTLKKSNSDKYISSAKKRLNPIVRQHSYPSVNATDECTGQRGCGVDNLRQACAKKLDATLILKPQKILFAEDQNFKTKNLEVFSLNEHPTKIFVSYSKSLDQNTSGYNTVNGSLDETPGRKTLETSETPRLRSTDTAEQGNKNRKSGNTGPGNERKSQDSAFPITFHSESLFLHPYENGFLSHKELHHISIQMVPADSTLPKGTNETSSTANDYYKTEIKLNVNESDASGVNESECQNTKTDYSRHNEEQPNSTEREQEETSAKNELSRIRRCAPRDLVSGDQGTQELGQRETNMDNVNVSQRPNVYETYNDVNYIECKLVQQHNDDDCSVPTQNYPLNAGGEQTKLKIEVDAADVDLSNGLHNVLLGRSAKHGTADKHVYLPGDGLQTDTGHLRNKYTTNDKYNSKAALNYLFQKLGDTYPKRCLLKQPSFHYANSQYGHGRYYSDLPEIERTEIPQTVLFNNQTYDILCGSLLPGQRSNSFSNKYENNVASVSSVSDAPLLATIKISGDEHLSDSDISIADSLEDVQLTKSTTKRNKYEKYDEKLTRGVVCGVKANIIRPKRCGQSISYFINLGESNLRKKNAMPAKLRERLATRSKSISKHSSCGVDMRKKSPRSTKLIHKQIQTCLNADNSLRKRRKKAANVGRVSDESKPADVKCDRKANDDDLDERIMNILLSGLRMQETGGEENKTVVDLSTSKIRNIASRSVQTESVEQNFESPILSEYVEMIKISSPAKGTAADTPPNEYCNGEPDETDDQDVFHPDESSASVQNNLYEVTVSEEVANINSTKYYRSIKKSRRIYYPTKTAADKRYSLGRNVSAEQTSSTWVPNQNVPSFSKYQKKLKEFKQQMRRQNFDKVTANYDAVAVNDASPLNFNDSSANETAGLSALQYTRMRDKSKAKNQTAKIAGPRSHRFYQRFEAIPEEFSNSLEVADQIQDTTNSVAGEYEAPSTRSNDLNTVIETSVGEKVDRSEYDINGNETSRAKTEITLSDNFNEEKPPENEDANQKQRQNNINVNSSPKDEKEPEQYKNNLKSQKGRDSLSVIREQEELITLSRGWINFYLLNGNNTEDNISGEIEDESLALSETFRIPQKYMVHVHATPENVNEQTPKSSTTLPGLCKSSKNHPYKPGTVTHIDKTSLPDIGTVLCPKTINTASSKNCSWRNSLPKLHLSGDESDVGSRKSEDAHSHVESTTEPVSTPQGVVPTEKSSSVMLSSNHSHSSVEDESERNDNVKKFQRYQRPHTYHSTRNNNNRWLLTIEGNHNTSEKRASSDVEMQLSFKNSRECSSNHSWKFTMKNEEVCLPHLNVNYKILPFPIYEDENTNTSYSENNSRSNSTLSFTERKTTQKSSSSNPTHHIRRLNSRDKTLPIRRSDELTIRGSAITPERKPRVPTMSERDLTRMKLIKPTNMENNLV